MLISCVSTFSKLFTLNMYCCVIRKQNIEYYLKTNTWGKQTMLNNYNFMVENKDILKQVTYKELFLNLLWDHWSSRTWCDGTEDREPLGGIGWRELLLAKFCFLWSSERVGGEASVFILISAYKVWRFIISSQDLTRAL